MGGDRNNSGVQIFLSLRNFLQYAGFSKKGQHNSWIDVKYSFGLFLNGCKSRFIPQELKICRPLGMKAEKNNNNKLAYTLWARQRDRTAVPMPKLHPRNNLHLAFFHFKYVLR